VAIKIRFHRIDISWEEFVTTFELLLTAFE